MIEQLTFSLLALGNKALSRFMSCYVVQVFSEVLKINPRDRVYYFVCMSSMNIFFLLNLHVIHSLYISELSECQKLSLL